MSLSVFDEEIPEIMKSIGFKRKQGRHYTHTQCKLFVEFVVGPAGIGDDIQIKPAKKNVDGQVLYIYSPSDCIRDRLASYIHFRLLSRICG